MANKLVKLKDGNDVLYPEAMAYPNLSNVLATKTSNGSYTANEDCFIRIEYSDMSAGDEGAYISANNKMLFIDWWGSAYHGNSVYPLFIKKGQTVSYTADRDRPVVIYGAKYV